MSKAALISIKPKWCEKIINGDKTIEVRKTRPKLDTPFKCYIYCTQGGVALGAWGKHGKVIGEFTCDRIDWITQLHGLPTHGLHVLRVWCSSRKRREPIRAHEAHAPEAL